MRPVLIRWSSACVFDIESKESFKHPVSAKRVVISDNTGTSEVLSEASSREFMLRRLTAFAER